MLLVDRLTQLHNRNKQAQEAQAAKTVVLFLSHINKLTIHYNLYSFKEHFQYQ